MNYVLVGGPFEIVDTPHKYEIWGQSVEIPDELAKRAILDGAPLLPKEQFDTIGFTAEDMQFSNSRLHMTAPADFQRKLDRALAAARQYQATLVTPPPPVAAAVEEHV